MSTDFVDLVNPLQGTNSRHEFSRGNTAPLVARPFGMTAWSPQTDESSDWFFHSAAPKLQGLRATHQPSPWIGDYGHFVLMPQVGDMQLSATDRASSYRPDQTIVRPDYFRTVLGRYQTTVELTPTDRCAVFRFTFPAGTTARVILHLFAGESDLQFDLATGTIRGFTRAKTGGTPDNFACYIVAQFDRPFTKATAFQTSPQRAGTSAEFSTAHNATVTVKVATSFISLDQAQRNLQREIGDRSFDAIRAAGRAEWNALLGRVEIDGASDAERRTFYSCLYRTLLFPRRFYEYDAAGQPTHYSPYDGRIHPGVLYADNGFWDTFRTVYPLFSILYPDKLPEILAGWVQAYREGGWFPKWASPGYRACMIGTHLDAVLADAVVKGIGGFDLETAYAGMRKNALETGDAAGNFGRRGIEQYQRLGYVPADEVPSAAARTQEFAYNDFCVAQVAKVLGRDADYQLFSQRAGNYRNVFDPRVGFMRGRNADGSWEEPFDEFRWGGAYIEGSAWQYSWAVPHDPAGLIALHGGPAAFTAKLDRLLALPPHFHTGTYITEIHEMTEMAAANFGQYAHSNQPVHHVLHLFTCAGQPWKTQFWVRRVLRELYTPDDLPGDEDNGEMSAWYVLNVLGFYPLCPGQPEYLLGSPLFPRATLRFPTGKTLTITAAGNAPDHIYVKHPKPFVSHADLVAGGEWRFSREPLP